MCDEMEKNDAKTWRGEVHFITQAGDEARAVVGEEAGAVVGTKGRRAAQEKTKLEVAMINNNNHNNNNNNNLGD